MLLKIFQAQDPNDKPKPPKEDWDNWSPPGPPTR